jgi:hypothetical protein
MPVLSPSQTEGVKLQEFKTLMLARSNLRPGQVAAMKQPENVGGHMREAVKIEGPASLNSPMCVMLEDVVSGQSGKALISGIGYEVELHFKHSIKWGDPLVVNVQGALTPDGERGDRIVAYARCNIGERSKEGRTLGAVLFDGLGGFGSLQ